jgi:hypothetical protein
LVSAARDAADDAVSGPGDPAELLDVDVDELAGPLALVAARRLEAELAEATHPDPLEDAPHRRLWHRQALGDLRPGHPHTAQRGDHLDPFLRGAVRDPAERAGAVKQTRLALLPEAASPLARRALAHLGGRGRRSERPVLLHNPPGKNTPLVQTERRVSVKIHPVSSLGLSGMSTSQPPRRLG